jgi:hypothetical protein
MMSIVKRLINAGAPVDGIRSRFHVLFDQGGRDLLSPEARSSTRLVTLDALNPAVTSFGLDPYHPGGIDTVLQECLRPFILNGACGVFLDHVGHENKERQHGAIRKSQAVQGALYEAVKISSLKPGTTGKTRMVLRKDNRGSLGDMEGKTLATVVMVSEVEGGGLAGKVSTTFTEPDPFNETSLTEEPRPEENNIDRIIREMDAAGLPSELTQNASKDWLRDNEVEIKARASDWRAAWAVRKGRDEAIAKGL